MIGPLKKYTILTIEDNSHFRRFLVKTLSPLANIVEIDNESDALTQIQKNHFDVVIIDINLHGNAEGFNILKKAKEKGLFSIMLTDQDDEDSITKSYKLGCNHYLTKDQSENVLKFIVKDHLTELEDQCSPNIFQKDYVTQDDQLINEISTLKKRLSNNRSVLIIGESGVGKTRLAKTIHSICGGDSQNFISLSPEMITSDVQDLDRELVKASNGTIFSHDVTAMSLVLQQKFLESVNGKFNLITSTCDDIYKFIQEGQFRVDLYRRISGVTITIPPLRERIEDIPLLINFFIKKLSRQIAINPKAMDILKKYSWPGNIRELKSTVEQLSVADSKEIGINHLPAHIQQNKSEYATKINKRLITEDQISYTKKHGIAKLVERIEAEMLMEMIKQGSNRPMNTIKLLHICRAQYYKMLKDAQNFKDELTYAPFLSIEQGKRENYNNSNITIQ